MASAPPFASPVRVQLFLFYFCTPELLVTKGLIFSLGSALAFERLAAFLGTSADHSVISVSDSPDIAEKLSKQIPTRKVKPDTKTRSQTVIRSFVSLARLDLLGPYCFPYLLIMFLTQLQLKTMKIL